MREAGAERFLDMKIYQRAYYEALSEASGRISDRYKEKRRAEHPMSEEDRAAWDALDALGKRLLRELPANYLQTAEDFPKVAKDDEEHAEFEESITSEISERLAEVGKADGGQQLNALLLASAIKRAEAAGVEVSAFGEEISQDNLKNSSEKAQCQILASLVIELDPKSHLHMVKKR